VKKSVLGARTKLNDVYVVGSVALAGIVGIATGSWLVFAVAGASLIAASLDTGNIRPDKGGRRKPVCHSDSRVWLKEGPVEKDVTYEIDRFCS
jgi:hypothetical protein